VRVPKSSEIAFTFMADAPKKILKEDSLFYYLHLNNFIKVENVSFSDSSKIIQLILIGSNENVQIDNTDYFNELPYELGQILCARSRMNKFLDLIVKLSIYLDFDPSQIKFRLVYYNSRDDIYISFNDGYLGFSAMANPGKYSPKYDQSYLHGGLVGKLLGFLKLDTLTLGVEVPPIDLNIKSSPGNIRELNNVCLNEFIKQRYIKKFGTDIVKRKGNIVRLMKVTKEISSDEGIWTYLVITFYFTLSDKNTVQLELNIDGKWFRAKNITVEALIEAGGDHDLDYSEVYRTEVEEYGRQIQEEFQKFLLDYPITKSP
jgi:hypothetical protein